jgi:hypothetical protein
VPDQSGAVSSNSSWRGVNFPTSVSTTNYQLPSQSEIIAILVRPVQERDVGVVRKNEFGSYTIPMTSGIDIDIYEWQVLPAEIMYRSYLASQKESRLAAQLANATDNEMLWDGFAGGRFGLLRYGNRDPIYPQGMQVDVEGAGLVRLDVYNDVDVQSVDFRVGVPISFVWGRHQARVGYYHLSSHTGDEFLLKNPSHDRLNFARDVLFLGYGYYLTPEFRMYGEMGWAFYSDVANEWEFRFGMDYSPRFPTGKRGAPFFGIHGHLRRKPITVEVCLHRSDGLGKVSEDPAFFVLVCTITTATARSIPFIVSTSSKSVSVCGTTFSETPAKTGVSIMAPNVLC